MDLMSNQGSLNWRPSGAGAHAGLQIGDLITHLGTQPLKGVGPTRQHRSALELPRPCSCASYAMAFRDSW